MYMALSNLGFWLLNAMFELVMMWRKVVFATAPRVADLPPSICRTTGKVAHLLRGVGKSGWPARCICCASAPRMPELGDLRRRCEQAPASASVAWMV